MTTDELLEQILRAPVYDVAVETPLDRADLLSTALRNEGVVFTNLGRMADFSGWAARAASSF